MHDIVCDVCVCVYVCVRVYVCVTVYVCVCVCVCWVVEVNRRLYCRVVRPLIAIPLRSPVKLNSLWGKYGEAFYLVSSQFLQLPWFC